MQAKLAQSKLHAEQLEQQLTEAQKQCEEAQDNADGMWMQLAEAQHDAEDLRNQLVEAQVEAELLKHQLGYPQCRTPVTNTLTEHPVSAPTVKAVNVLSYAPSAGSPNEEKSTVIAGGSDIVHLQNVVDCSQQSDSNTAMAALTGKHHTPVKAAVSTSGSLKLQPTGVESPRTPQQAVAPSARVAQAIRAQVMRRVHGGVKTHSSRALQQQAQQHANADQPYQFGNSPAADTVTSTKQQVNNDHEAVQQEYCANDNGHSGYAVNSSSQSANTTSTNLPPTAGAKGTNPTLCQTITVDKYQPGQVASDNTDLELQLAVALDEADTLRLSLAKSEEANQNLQQKCATLEAYSADLRQQLAAAQLTAQNSTAGAERAKAEVTQLQQQLTDATQQLDALKQQLLEAQVDKQETVERYKAMLDKSRTAIQTKDAKLQRYAEELGYHVKMVEGLGARQVHEFNRYKFYLSSRGIPLSKESVVDECQQCLKEGKCGWHGGPWKVISMAALKGLK